MDFSLRNSLKHMRKLWAGEELIHTLPPRWEQGNCSLDKQFFDTANTEAKVLVTDALESTSFTFLQDDSSPGDNTNSSSFVQHKFAGKMAAIIGNYQHERNENIDEYFKAVGVPYVPRKMMEMASPRLEITKNEEKWTIRTVSMLRTAELSFTLGEEYEENMPGTTLKNVTTIEGDSLVTVSVGPDNNKVVRKYEVTGDELVLTLTHEKSGQVAKRYFKRLS